MPGLNPVRAVRSLIPEPGPRRFYALATLTNTFGFGLLLGSMPLYFTRIVHLSTGQVGLGLTIAATTGLLTGVPIGDLADRRGPVEMAKTILFLQCGATIAYLFIRNFAGFVAVAVADMLALNAYFAADSSVLRRVGGEDAADFRASIYAIANLGISIGAVGCGIAIQIDTPTAYHVLLTVDALSFLGAWLLLRRLPRYDPLPKPASAPRWGVLRDKSFVAYTTLSGAMYLQFPVITVFLPLWVVDDTHAPRWCIPIFLVINTLLVILFQVRIGNRVKTLRQGGAAMRRAGVIFLFSCSVIGLAAGLPSWAALLLLVAGVCLHTGGEMWQSAASFALEFGLAPAHAQGQYQGFVQLGTGTGEAAAPVLLLGLVLSLGRSGLFGLGAFLAIAGMVMPAVARWGERTRPPSPDPADSEIGHSGVTQSASG